MGAGDLNRITQLVVGAFLLLCCAQFQAQEADFKRDIVYGHKAGMALVYQVLQPAEPNGAAMVFMISGGWFSWYMTEELQREWLGYLADEGYTVFAVNHGSAPRFKVPKAVADVRRAIRHIQLNADAYGIDVNRIGVIGMSAGGHLSLMLGLTGDSGNPEHEDPVERTGNSIGAVVAYFPPVDLTKIAGPNKDFPALDFDPTQAGAVSPIEFITKDDPPVLLIHGDKDTLVPISNSTNIKAKLEEAGVWNKMVTMKGVGHDTGTPETVANVRKEIVTFLNEHLVASNE